MNRVGKKGDEEYNLNFKFQKKNYQFLGKY